MAVSGSSRLGARAGAVADSHRHRRSNAHAPTFLPPRTDPKDAWYRPVVPVADRGWVGRSPMLVRPASFTALATRRGWGAGTPKGQQLASGDAADQVAEVQGRAELGWARRPLGDRADQRPGGVVAINARSIPIGVDLPAQIAPEQRDCPLRAFDGSMRRTSSTTGTHGA